MCGLRDRGRPLGDVWPVGRTPLSGLRAQAQRTTASGVRAGAGHGSTGQPYVVYGIMGLSVLLTLAFWSKQPFVLTYLLANPFPVWDGQLWRLLTSTLLHADAIHLLFNLYWLRQFGSVVEDWMGSLRFAGFFVVTALASSAAQFLFDAGGIGLSGVGYASIWPALRPPPRQGLCRRPDAAPGVVQVLVGWFFLCILLTTTGVWHVGNVAHGAGAAIGWLIGRAVLPRQRAVLLTGLTVLLLAFTTLTLYMPWNGQWAYHRGLQALKENDMPTALYWLRKAADAHPDNAELRQFVKEMENLGKAEPE